MWTGGVRVIIENDEQKILMVKQEHPERTVWMVPGGGIEEGETAAEAVVREMKEETGLDVTVGPMIFHIEEVSEKRGQRFVNFFMATVAGGDMHLGMDPEFDAEHQVLKELKFLSREEIQALPHVYPEFLRDEVWELLDAGKLYDAFRIREPWKK
ncbi:MAG: NUDIX hydrolase [Firmicutes bacterium]|jgi:ADP-ribose pyrophosphatase YjhB (NUDIX family)|nr:NUDIX hydrolase [Bacillota bacterium]MBQ5797395.1 NUDIX hydrolase [Bacillota bacterium]MBR6500348.1 NUDIX hydrolase [Bacillota bacterium]